MLVLHMDYRKLGRYGPPTRNSYFSNTVIIKFVATKPLNHSNWRKHTPNQFLENIEIL